MRRAMLFLIGLLLGVCTANVPAAASPSQMSDHIAGASALESKTVALVQSDGLGSVQPFCTGVWVSSTTILTALHCVDGEALIGYVVHEDIYPRGSHVANDIIQPRAAVTYAIDEAHDIALLRAYAVPTGHGVAYPRIGTVEQGSFAQGMGMPMGIWYTYASGDVSAVRVADLGSGGDVLYVQTTTPTSAGCSGGGLFDREGALIGVAHATASKGQALNFFVHKSYVETLLQAQGKAL
jgi:S1-C subfamily serine protease